MDASAEMDLARRLAAGDANALADAHRVHAARCRGISYRILGDEAAAQDAVQEAFLSLWRHRAGLVVTGAGIAPWLTVATRNAALNIVRSRTRRESREAAAAPAETSGGGDPYEAAAAGIDAAAVRDAVAGLPLEQRTVIQLAYFRGKTLAQVASETGAPLGTVKRRAQLALARLARSMGARP